MEVITVGGFFGDLGVKVGVCRFGVFEYFLGVEMVHCQFGQLGKSERSYLDLK